MLLEGKEITKYYYDEARQTRALDEVSLTIEDREMVAILGSSGSGKSTLLHILGGLDQPTSGEVLLHGQSLQRSSESKLARLRNNYLGFVYQFHHLLADFSALENVMMPLLIGKYNRSEAQDRAEKMLTEVGLARRANHRPASLSGGERQRVAIARALVNQPKLVLADEPTGNLDRKTAEAIFELIQHLNQKQGTAFLVVTHDLELTSKLPRRLLMQDGTLRDIADELPFVY